MLSKTIKFIGWLLIILMIFDAWLFINLEVETAIYILLFSILLLLITFRFFIIRIKKLEKRNAGLKHVLDKSEESRINAENLKNKVLLMIDDLPEGLLIISKDNKTLVINSRAEKFLGIDKKQVLNKSVLELGHLTGFKEIVFPLLFSSRVHKKEIELKKDLILSLSIEPLALEKNNTAKLIILNDITKVKQAEISKNHLISVAAHQLKSPLSATRLSLKMLLAKDFGKITKKQRDVLEKTYRNNESLIYLVEDLLNDSKNHEGAQPDKRSLISLEDLVSSVIDFYKDGMKAKKISFKFNKPGRKLPKLFVEPEKMKMVVQNLFDNAIKYTPEKGKIEVSITPKRGELEFEIKDTGVGIPEDQNEKIFTRFYRTANAVESETEGSGLGLSIAKDILKKYHGKIWFQSKENEGSTFFFSLPFVNT